MTTSRRRMLGMTAGAPFVLLGLGSSAMAADACFDLATMSANDKSLRASLNFKPAAPDPMKHCGVCAFFMPSEGNCGKCVLLSGGAVSTTSVCDSWAMKQS